MEREIEKDLIEIECAIKSQEEKDNVFTMSVLQRCHKLVLQLKGYKALEEQRKLLKLPCVPGQSVWKIKNGKILKRVVGTIKIEASGISFYNAVYICDISDFGKTVFITREEAEAALKE